MSGAWRRPPFSATATTASAPGSDFAHKRRAFERVDGDVDRRAAAPELLPNIEHRHLVALALADHDLAGNRQVGDFAAHGLDRCSVGLPFIATPAKTGSGDRSALRHARDVERKGARKAACAIGSPIPIDCP